jgi:hypothetical protein
MDIAKPPGGFNVVEPAAVRSMIAAHAAQWPRIQAHWNDIKARLKQTGHRDGVRVNGPPGARLFVAAGGQASGLPTIKIAYTVLGDTLIIRMATVE